MKKPAPPAPSCVTVSPVENRRSRIVAAICPSSRSSRPAKRGTFFSTSDEARATAELYTVLPVRRNRQDTPVQLTGIGCSPARPTAGGAPAGCLVEGEGRLLLDCGPGVLARLRKVDGGWPHVDAVVITHFHLDHWGDLVPWIVGASFGPGREGNTPELLPTHGGTE